ncbi:MAG: hypothetical protein M1815_000243 [Lichina confinis]|nr:MAG: hypothetical protein M1815_000243 [Lichina confinis]
MAAATSSAMAMPQFADRFLQDCKKCYDDCAYRRTGLTARRRFIGLAAAAGEPPCSCAQQACPSALDTATQLEQHRGKPRVYKPQPHGTESLIQGPR